MTIRPEPWAIITRPAAWLVKKVPLRLSATVASKSSTLTSSAGVSGGPMPALLTRTSSRPKCSRVAATAVLDLLEVGDVHLQRQRADLLGQVGCPWLASRSPSATSAPASASATAIARPMPRAAPVTRQTCPSSPKSGTPQP